MSKNTPSILTSSEFKQILKGEHTAQNKPLCFILGAGASVKSGIPTGRTLSREWLEKLHLLHDLKHHKRTVEEWFQSTDFPKKFSGLKDVDHDHPEKHYFEIHNALYSEQPKQSHDFLEAKMENKTPSFGYHILAYLLDHSPHKTVITTNFDNLVADAFFTLGTTIPRLVVHESLCQFVETPVNRPLIVKVHGHLGFDLKNDPEQMESLPYAWKDALINLLDHHTPVVIGYDGYDHTLMELLRHHRPPSSRPIYWCQYCSEEDPSPKTLLEHLPEHVRKLSPETSVSYVPFHDFDDLMNDIFINVVHEKTAQDILNLIQSRSEHRQQQLKEQGKQLAGGNQNARDPEPSQDPTTPDQTKTDDATSSKIIEKTKSRERDWWDWLLEINALSTAEEQNNKYLEALEELPNSANLHERYASFLHNKLDRPSDAKKHFLKALEINPDNDTTHNNYAYLLHHKLDRPDDAEKHFLKALKINPDNDAAIHNNYAYLLHDKLNRTDDAEKHFLKALEINPDNDTTHNNYASLLHDKLDLPDDAEKHFLKALKINPDNDATHNNYAYLLHDKLNRPDDAEKHFLKSLEINPDNNTAHNNYARLLHDKLNRPDDAEKHFLKALALNKNNYIANANYALFLLDFERLSDSLKYYKKAFVEQATDAYPQLFVKHAIGFTYALWLDGKDDNDIPLGVSKYLLSQELAPSPYSFKRILSQFKSGNPQQTFASDLAKVYNGKKKAKSLNQYNQWKQLDSIDPNSSKFTNFVKQLS